MPKIIIFLTLFSTVCVSQQFVVKGRIVNKNGSPLPFIEIRTGHVVGDSVVSKADAYGHFRIVLLCGEPKNIFFFLGNKSCCIIPLLTDLKDSVSLLVQADTIKQATFQFSYPYSRTARFARLHLDLSQNYMDFVQSLGKLEQAGQDTKAIISSLMDSAANLKKMVLLEKDPIIRGELLLRYYRLTSLHGLTFDTLLYKKIVTSIPASSPLWFFNNYEAYDQTSIHPKGKAFVDGMIENHPSKELRAFLLFETAMEAQRNMNEYEVRRNYIRLKEDFPNVFWSKIANRWIMVDVKVKRGAQIPDFSFKDMNDTTIIYSKSSLKGKIFLLDFWATWCLACISEIPYLQKAYEKYYSKGLQIISISSDVKRSDVNRYRKQKAKMPWKQVWISESELNMIHDKFEITGIPKPILVDRNGEIIGLKSEVRGENLNKVLEKILGK